MARDRTDKSDPFPEFEDREYVVTGELGSGGFGRVYSGWAPRLGRPVAIKVLRDPNGASEDVKRRFENEGRILAQFKHHSIPRVFGVKPSLYGELCLVMELVVGLTLRDRLKSGPLSMTDALRLGVQIADALAEVHAEKIFHRDIKPENIIIEAKSGTPVLVDFGLASARDSRFVSGSMAGKPSQPGLILGTYGYLSPEQARGEPASGQSDLFALGCVLYETLTGQMAYPLAGRTVDAYSHPPSLGALPATGTRELHTLLRDLLAVALADRSKSATQVKSQLEVQLAIAERETEVAATKTTIDVIAPLMWRGDAGDVPCFRRAEKREKDGPEFVPCPASFAESEETIHLVPFESPYREAIMRHGNSEEAKRRNANFYLRVYLPRISDKTAKFQKVVVMLNGLAESSSKIFDGVGLQFAKDGIPAVLLPLPRHLSRAVHFVNHHDPFRPPKDFEKLYVQQMLQCVCAHPEMLVRMFRQVFRDIEHLLADIRRKDHPFFGGLFAKNASPSLMGYSIGGLYSLAVTLLHVMERMDELVPAQDKRQPIPSDLDPGQRQQLLKSLPFSCMFLLESGLPLDQIDTGKLYYRDPETSRRLSEWYIYGPDAAKYRSFVDDNIEWLFSPTIESERAKRTKYNQELEKLTGGSSVAKQPSLFERDLQEADKVWQDIMIRFHRECEDLAGNERRAFRQVFLGEHPILYRDSLKLLDRRLLIVTGGADEIFPAQKLLASSAGKLATLQVPGISHWLKAGAAKHWDYWESVVVELMKQFEMTAASSDQT